MRSASSTGAGLVTHQGVVRSGSVRDVTVELEANRVGVVVLATIVPAWRAARLNPATVLRPE